VDSALKPLESERMSKYGNRHSKEFKQEAVRFADFAIFWGFYGFL